MRYDDGDPTEHRAPKFCVGDRVLPLLLLVLWLRLR